MFAVIAKVACYSFGNSTAYDYEALIVEKAFEE